MAYIKIQTEYLKCSFYFIGSSRGDSIDLAILVLEHCWDDVLNPDTVHTSYVHIINLPDAGATCPKGKKLVTSGWGQDRYNKKRKRDRLWAVFQECLENDRCGSGVAPHYLCGADSTRPHNSICSGDSGGRIFLHNLSHFDFIH